MFLKLGLSHDKCSKHYKVYTIKTLACPCNIYPLTAVKSHFYIVKVGNTGVYLFFLFLIQNIDCGYSLEPPKKNLCILHGCVCVMG